MKENDLKYSKSFPVTCELIEELVYSTSYLRTADENSADNQSEDKEKLINNILEILLGKEAEIANKKKTRKIGFVKGDRKLAFQMIELIQEKGLNVGQAVDEVLPRAGRQSHTTQDESVRERLLKAYQKVSRERKELKNKPLPTDELINQIKEDADLYSISKEEERHEEVNFIRSWLIKYREFINV